MTVSSYHKPAWGVAREVRRGKQLLSEGSSGGFGGPDAREKIWQSTADLGECHDGHGSGDALLFPPGILQHTTPCT